MQAELQRFKIEPAILGNDDFAIERAARRQLPPQRFDQLWEIAVERLFLAALDQDLFSVAEKRAARRGLSAVTAALSREPNDSNAGVGPFQ